MTPGELRESFNKALAELPVQETPSGNQADLTSLKFPEAGSLTWWIWVIILGAAVLSLFLFLLAVYWKSRNPDRKITGDTAAQPDSHEPGKGEWFERAKEAWIAGQGDMAARMLYTGVLEELGYLQGKRTLYELTSREILEDLPETLREDFRRLAELHARSRFGARLWSTGDWELAWGLAVGLRGKQ